jgi:hypothetical protein
MSQDLIEIHKLHLIQARTPAIDFSQVDSNNRLELRDINPPLPVSSSFFHTSSFLPLFITFFTSHYPTSLNNVTTSPPTSYIALIDPCTTKRSLELIPRRAGVPST